MPVHFDYTHNLWLHEYPVGIVQGSIDLISQYGVAGWAWDPMNPDQRLLVTVQVNDQLIAIGLCKDFREDLLNAGKGDGRHGFALSFPYPIESKAVPMIVVKATGVDLPRSPTCGAFADPAGRTDNGAANIVLDPATLLTTRDFSQYGEQTLILDYFDLHPAAPRYCVDVGAYDGFIGSNSRALLLRGWRGLLVEPDPRSFARLTALYADRPDVTCLRCAVADWVGVAQMRFSKGPAQTAATDEWKYAQVNSLSPTFAERYVSEYGYEYVSGPVSVTTLTRTLKWANAPRDIGFMSIDCEAVDSAIVSSFNFARYRPHLVCVEFTETSIEALAKIFGRWGYHFHAQTTSNALFAVD